MKLTVINGSPRGSNSNTRFLLDPFIQGFQSSSGRQAKITDLVKTLSARTLAGLLAETDRLILAFPLYTDAMPGLVKKFIEDLYSLSLKTVIRFPPMGFIIHSGFPEAAHSRPLEAYLKKLTKRLQTEYLGTVIKGGSEGIREMPAWMIRRTLDRFHTLGYRFGESGRFDPQISGLLAGPEKLNLPALSLFRFLHFTGLTQSYWNQEMKQNGSFDRRFAQPYFSQPSALLRNTNNTLMEGTCRSANETATY